MTNTNCLDGMQCPQCKSFEPFKIAVNTVMKVFDNGTDDHGDTEWDDDSYCECGECGFFATVADFSETSSGTKAEPAANLLETLRQGVKTAGEVVSRWERGDLAESVRSLGMWHAEAEAAIAEAMQIEGGTHG
jgi:hypothetical protein